MKPNSISVVIPARNARETIGECVSAILRAGGAGEVLVVDDASTDDTAAVARAAGAAVTTLAHRMGPAAARNLGVEQTRGDIIFFVDADVVVAEDAVSRVAANLAPGSNADAVFGSYDDAPAAAAYVSQYRNLLHHYVHQTAPAEATTFWGGCGAIRRSTFDALGGFNAERYPLPSMEDIDLGYRLTAAGYTIRLDKSLLATHLKQWSLISMVYTDMFARAIPWARLMLHHRAPPVLNTRASQRLSGILTVVGVGSLPAAALSSTALALSLSALAAVVLINAPFFLFLRRRRSLLFALGCVPLHLIYFLSGSAGYAYAWIEHRLGLSSV